jgi:hypothetical protein
MEVSGQLQTPGERAHGIHWIGGWVDAMVGLNFIKKRKSFTLLGLKLRPIFAESSLAFVQKIFSLVSQIPFLRTNTVRL